MKKRILSTLLTLVLVLSTNFTQPIGAAETETSVSEVYCLVVAADFNGDGEKKLKEYFEFYKTSHEKYLGEKIVYEWHYFPKDKIPKVLQQSVITDYSIDGIYKACIELYGQKYWQRVLVSYEMEGGEIAPQKFGYDYDTEHYVLLQGFYEKQLGIHGECHALEESVKYLNSVLNKSDPKNWMLEPNEKLKKFWLENGWCHYVVQKDVDRYVKQYGHAQIKWNDPKWKEWQVDYKRNGEYAHLELGSAEGKQYAEKPQGVYWYGLCEVVGVPLGSRLHELTTMQRLQQEFGVTLVSITPRHEKAKVPKPATSIVTKKE